MLKMGYKYDLIHLKEYMLSTWHTAILWQSLLTCLNGSDENRVLAFEIQLICSEYGFKHNLRLIKEFVFLRLAYCLSLLNMDWEHDSRTEMK